MYYQQQLNGIGILKVMFEEKSKPHLSISTVKRTA